MKSLFLVSSLLLMPVAWADEFPTPPDLPPTAVARGILAKDPHVIAAQAREHMAVMEGEQLKASSYQWSVRMAGQQRRYTSGTSPSNGASNEWNAELQRPIRLPGKGTLDRRIAEAGRTEAEAGVGEAMHEAARSLVSLWLDWQGTTAKLQLMRQQEKLVQEDLAAVIQRLRAGDAARMDKGIAVAARATARQAVIEADTEAAEARARLETHFPGIDLQAPPALATPALLTGNLNQWQERVMQHNDPMRIAQARLDKAKHQAARARADRMPDPTIGVFTASEVYGNERVLGFSVSVPLPGRYRFLEAERAGQAVAVAEQELENEKRALMTEVNASHAAAAGRYSAWQAAEESAQETRSSAESLAKAYALGEAGLQALLQARRQGIDTELSALNAKITSLRTNYLLLVDGHYLWDLAHEEESEN